MNSTLFMTSLVWLLTKLTFKLWWMEHSSWQLVGQCIVMACLCLPCIRLYYKPVVQTPVIREGAPMIFELLIDRDVGNNVAELVPVVGIECVKALANKMICFLCFTGNKKTAHSFLQCFLPSPFSKTSIY